ncbi:hypothetical protein CALVIDRAFT_542821 [Calocera viscosa TUFC12733]|uniref:Uncharacterized protein n=1 Tax=Calocera viscosa (strain TUFC12733) TaxID=1330018 RepID=A0A167G9U5_CALVF|nr:hypothetical protein CALVIDRAFT_542821 [Calocera viscosa TUFC12733]
MKASSWSSGKRYTEGTTPTVYARWTPGPTGGLGCRKPLLWDPCDTPREETG